MRIRLLYKPQGEFAKRLDKKTGEGWSRPRPYRQRGDTPPKQCPSERGSNPTDSVDQSWKCHPHATHAQLPPPRVLGRGSWGSWAGGGVLGEQFSCQESMTILKKNHPQNEVTLKTGGGPGWLFPPQGGRQRRPVFPH